MPRSLVPRRSQIPVGAPDPILNSQIEATERSVVVASARVHGAAVVASSAMHHALALSCAADAAFRTSPMGENEYRAILMAYGNVAASEIQRIGMPSGGRC